MNAADISIKDIPKILHKLPLHEQGEEEPEGE